MRLWRAGLGRKGAARTATRFDRTRRISSRSTETRCERGASWSRSFARGILLTERYDEEDDEQHREHGDYGHLALRPAFFSTAFIFL